MDDDKIQTRFNRGQNILFVTVKEPGSTNFEGAAKAVTSFNDKGKFDVLPFHTNFISLIKEMVIIYKEDGSEKKIPLERGVIKVTADNVRILIGLKSIL